MRLRKARALNAGVGGGAVTKWTLWNMGMNFPTTGNRMLDSGVFEDCLMPDERRRWSRCEEAA